MGSFDDAIREHLELSRLHGADPNEVSRKELEAFGSPSTNTSQTSATHTAGDGASHEISVRRVFDAEAPADLADPHLSEETMELDMGAVLAGIAEDETPAGHTRHAPARIAARA
jgi:hypothetical protein